MPGVDLLGALAGPVVSGGLSLLGGMFQQQGMESSIDKQEAFQQQMSSSAYSRAVEDMKRADLNPALMYGSGGPESTPSGASMMPPNVLGGVASSAQDAIRLQKDLAVSDSNIAVNLANAAKTTAQIPKEKFEGDIAHAFDELAPALIRIFKKLGTSSNSALDQLSGDSSVPPEQPTFWKMLRGIYLKGHQQFQSGAKSPSGGH